MSDRTERHDGYPEADTRPYQVPLYGTPPGTRPYGEPGHALDPEDSPTATYPGSWSPYPEASQGFLALVLGIIGLFVFPPAAPAAWILGRQEVRGIDHGRRDPGHRGMGQAGRVLGIIGTVVLVVGVLLVALAVVVFVSAATSLLGG
jgi:hypothetical protein